MKLRPDQNLIDLLLHGFVSQIFIIIQQKIYEKLKLFYQKTRRLYQLNGCDYSSVQVIPTLLKPFNILVVSTLSFKYNQDLYTLSILTESMQQWSSGGS